MSDDLLTSFHLLVFQLIDCIFRLWLRLFETGQVNEPCCEWCPGQFHSGADLLLVCTGGCVLVLGEEEAGGGAPLHHGRQEGYP